MNTYTTMLLYESYVINTIICCFNKLVYSIIHSLAIKKVLVLIYNCDSIYCNIFACFAHCGMYDNDK